MSGLFKLFSKTSIIILILISLINFSYAISKEDIDGDGISNTLEIEQGTNPYKNEQIQITGFISADSSTVLKSSIIIFIVAATVIAEIIVAQYFRRKKDVE